jgi:hypothetical protein
MSEIADNKWEVQASKPPIMNFGGVVQIGMMVCFAGLFLFILIGSIMGIVTPKKAGGWEDKMGGPAAAPAADAAPAEGS